MTTTATTKIVMVAGQEFSVPAETDNEAIRAQLLSMGFADVAKPAEIKLGTRDGVQTVEFVKKAGTKGLGERDLAAFLAALPPTTIAAVRGLSAAQANGLRELAAGRLSIEAALTMDVELALVIARDLNRTHTPEEQLCSSVASISAVAAPAVLGW